jgi:pSer/pThr/pTyr-binding forkhead associated (FHA) protein
LDTEPIAVALKFGFLAVLYLFLLWVSRSALRELRKTGAPAPEATGFHAIGPRGRAAATDAFLVVVTGGGLQPGERFDLFGGLSIGRSSDADVRIEDRFASGVHARLYSRGASYYVEDMSSTNGTFLNGSQLHGESELHDLDTIKIGDTEMRFELDVPHADGDG